MNNLFNKLVGIYHLLKNDNKLKIIVFIIGSIIIFFNFAFFVGNNAVDIPFWDEWDLTEVVTEKTSISDILLYQHNDHKIGVGLLIIKILANLSGWSQIWEIKFVSFLIIISCLITLFIKKIISKRIDFFDLFIPLVFLNIFQYANISEGFQITYVLPLFFLCVWLLALRIKNNIIKFFILTVFALLGTYSSLKGIFLPIITIVFLIFNYSQYKNSKKRIFTITLLANITIILSFFIGYTIRPQAEVDLNSLISFETVKFLLTTIAYGFFYLANNCFIDYLIASFLLLIIFFFLAKGLYKIYMTKEINNSLVGVILIVYALMYIVTITLGRSELGLNAALSSRFVTFLMLLPIGLFFIFSDLKKGYILKIVLFIFILFNLISMSGRNLNIATNKTIGKQKVLECYKKANFNNYQKCYNIFKSYPNQKRLNKLIPNVLKIKNINNNF